MSRRIRLNRQVSKEAVEGHRGHGDDQIVAYGNPEVEHQRWLQKITDRVNRKLGNR